MLRWFYSPQWSPRCLDSINRKLIWMNLKIYVDHSSTELSISLSQLLNYSICLKSYVTNMWSFWHNFLNNKFVKVNVVYCYDSRCELWLLFEKQFSRKTLQMSNMLWLWSLCHMLWIRSYFNATYYRPSCTMYYYKIRFRWV